MLRGYLNQAAVYTPYGGVNQYGDVQDGAAVSVACRKEPSTKLVQNANGELYQTSVRYTLCSDDVAAPSVWKDKLDGHVIAEVHGMVTLGGAVVGYEVYV